jgi:integrase/recombinase XerC
MQQVLDAVERNTAAGKRDYAILALMVTGGLRDIEIHRANIEDLRTLGDSTVLYIQGKGKDEKADYIKVTPVVEAALRDYIKTRRKPAKEEALFTSLSNNSQGKRLSTRSISGIVKQRLKNAGFDSDRLTAHSLRHTAVTLSLIGGNTLQEVQQFARHENISTTQIYAHNLDRAKNRCEETISSSIFNA